MSGQFSVGYGVALIAGGLIGYFRTGSIISLLLGVVLGVWTVYNALHPTRQNNLANLCIATILGVVMLVRYLIGGKIFPPLVIAGLSAVQIYFHYPYLTK